MVIELIKGVALLLALSLLQSINSRFWHDRKTAGKVSSGVLFGVICIVGMMTPIVLTPGVFFDARSVVLSMAGLFGGPLVAGVAAIIAGGYRLWLGGRGVDVGLVVVLSSVSLGLLFRHAVARGWAKVGVWQLLVFGFVVHLLEVLLFIQLPAGVAPQVLASVSLPLLLTFTPATLFLGLLLQDGVHRAETEQALRESEARFRSLLQDIPGVAVQGYGPDGTINFWNAASERLYGFSAEEAIGRKKLDLIIPVRLRESVQQAMRQMFETHQTIPAAELLLMRQDGSEVPVFSSHGFVSHSGVDPEVFRFDIDLSERNRTEAELRIAAVAFEAQEGIIVTDAQQVILRVNKAFTDSVGYTEAEAVGQTLALIYSERHDDAFYADIHQQLQRSGQWAGEIWSRSQSGEVFPQWINITAVWNEKIQVSHYVATLTDITQRKAAEEHIRQLAFFDPLTGLPNRRLLLDRLQHALAVSGRNKRSGAVLFIDLDHFKTINDTLGHEKGDLLLQQVAKRLAGCIREGDTVARLGGDEFVVMLKELDAAREIAADEAKSVGEKILTLLNQPYRLIDFDFHSTSSIGVALYSGQSVSPADFIPLAEETGQILPLGNWVLETACAQLLAWAQQPAYAHLTLAVNVSARQFREPDFAHYLLGLLDYTGANPKKLKLELTESVLAANLEDIVSKMTALRERGVSFSLDDFGTGYSSLSYLKRLPLDQLKIDQSFVRDVLIDPNDAAIAKTVVALAQSLGLAVIAEGVETEAQRDFLAQHGCHAYQGYLFSRPLPLDEFEQFLGSVSARIPLPV